MASKNEWFARVMGADIGPLSSTQLVEMANKGQISPDDMVRKGADGQWVAAGTVKGLFSARPSQSSQAASQAAMPPQPTHQYAATTPVAVAQPSSPPKKSKILLWIVLVPLVGLPSCCCGLGMLGMIGAGLDPERRDRITEAASERREARARDDEAVPQSATAPSRPARVERITLEKFTQLREGMSYREVVDILGKEGTVLSEVNLGGIQTIMYQWDAGFLANMNAQFQNDRLVTKAQFGLK